MEQSLSPLEIRFRDSNRRKVALSGLVLAASVCVAFASIFLSQLSSITPDVTWSVLTAHFHGTVVDDRIAELVVWEYNVPRAIMGVVCGAGLAVGGAVMQSLMRNPLADPYTTGVASGASFGAALMFILGISLIPTGGNYNLSVTLNAAILAMVPTLAIVIISKHRRITPTTMILAGIAIMYVFRATTSLMTTLADPENVEQLYIWNVGSLGPSSWDNVWIVTAVVLVSLAMLQLLSRDIGVMTSGDRSATSLGVETRHIRAVSLAIVAVMTATMVGFTGTIGFMGLVAPHIARIFVGSNVRYLIPCSAAIGALILVCADCVAKVLIGIPVGVVTSIIGGPIFIILLIKGAKKVWF